MKGNVEIDVKTGQAATRARMKKSSVKPDFNGSG